MRLDRRTLRATRLSGQTGITGPVVPYSCEHLPPDLVQQPGTCAVTGFCTDALKTVHNLWTNLWMMRERVVRQRVANGAAVTNDGEGDRAYGRTRPRFGVDPHTRDPRCERSSTPAPGVAAAHPAAGPHGGHRTAGHSERVRQGRGRDQAPRPHHPGAVPRAGSRHLGRGDGPAGAAAAAARAIVP